MVTVVIAVIASALFGTGVALQQRPARNVSVEYAARLGLLAKLARRPLWLVGIAAELAGFAFQVLALGRGSLVVVQPIITVSLLFTVALSGLWSGDRVVSRDWLAVLAVVAGLAVFLTLASPSEHSSGEASGREWALMAVVVGGAVGVLLVAGRHRGGRGRAALLGLAAGTADAVMAVITKAFAHHLHSGLSDALHSWTPYVLCGVGIVALLLSQTAYQVGRPTISLPLITVADPIISSAIGVALFGEVLHIDGGRGPAALGAALMMIVGLVVLNRSTVVIKAEQVGTPSSAGRSS